MSVGMFKSDKLTIGKVARMIYSCSYFQTSFPTNFFAYLLSVVFVTRIDFLNGNNNVLSSSIIHHEVALEVLTKKSKNQPENYQHTLKLHHSFYNTEREEKKILK